MQPFWPVFIIRHFCQQLEDEGRRKSVCRMEKRLKQRAGPETDVVVSKAREKIIFLNTETAFCLSETVPRIPARKSSSQ